MLKEQVFEMKRNHLIEKSIAIFLEKPVDDIKINELCKEIGISKKSFYTYFTSKVELYLEIDKKILIDIFIPVLSNYGNHHTGFDKLQSIITKFKDLAFEKPRYYRVTYMNYNILKLNINKPEFKKIKDFRLEYANLFASPFREGINDGSIKNINGLSHFTINSGLHGIFFYMFTDGELSRNSIEKYKTEATAYINVMLSAVKNN